MNSNEISHYSPNQPCFPDPKSKIANPKSLDQLVRTPASQQKRGPLTEVATGSYIGAYEIRRFKGPEKQAQRVRAPCRVRRDGIGHRSRSGCRGARSA